MGTTNSKPPGPIIMINHSEILSCSQVQFITLFFLEVHNYVASLPATASSTTLVQKNQFPDLKPAHFDFFAINFTICSHILCTGGDALTIFHVKYSNTWNPESRGCFERKELVLCKYLDLSVKSVKTGSVGSGYQEPDQISWIWPNQNIKNSI